MVNDIIYAKTQKGFEEMTRRTYRLPARMRALLIMIDGKQAAGELIARSTNQEESEHVIEKLLAEGFIEPIDHPSARTPGTGSSLAATTRTLQPAPLPQVDALALAAAKRYMTQAMLDALGADADRFTMKIDLVSGIDELRSMALDYLVVIRHSSDRRKADAFRDGLVHLKLIAPTDAVPAPAASASSDTVPAARRLMVQLLVEALGPDADMFTPTVERAENADELRGLLFKYQDAVRARSGRKKAEEFATRVGAILDQPRNLS